MKITQEVLDLISKKSMNMIKKTIGDSYLSAPTPLYIARGSEDWVADLALSIVDSAEAVREALIKGRIKNKENDIKIQLVKNMIGGDDVTATFSIGTGDKDTDKVIALAYYGGNTVNKEGETIIFSANQKLLIDKDVIDDAADRLVLKLIKKFKDDLDVKSLQEKIDKETKVGS